MASFFFYVGRLMSITIHEIMNHQGEKLDYTLHEAEKETNQLLVIGHGVTGNKDRPLIVALANAVAEKGIHALRFSFSGNGTSEGKFTDCCISKEIEDLGAGEIFLNSIDRDGSKIGYDINLVKKITDAVSIPVIACGGVGDFSHFASGIIDGGASAVAAGNIFHYIEHSTIIAKMNLLQSDVDIRMDSEATYKGRQFDKTGRLMMMSKEDLSKIEFTKGKQDLI